MGWAKCLQGELGREKERWKCFMSKATNAVCVERTWFDFATKDRNDPSLECWRFEIPGIDSGIIGDSLGNYPHSDMRLFEWRPSDRGDWHCWLWLLCSALQLPLNRWKTPFRQVNNRVSWSFVGWVRVSGLWLGELRPKWKREEEEDDEEEEEGGNNHSLQ